MDWEIGLMLFAIVGVHFTVIWLSLKYVMKCFSKFDLGPLILWFRMFSGITWATFVGLLILYCFIGA